jgi:catechol 2,3-dioxygenase-like lactoylglutathione lyase family enzyme
MSPEHEASIDRTASARPSVPRGNVKLGYLRFEVTDLPRWQRLLQSVIGMVPGDPGTDGALVFTHDQYQHRVALSSGTSDDVTAVGWEAGDDATFESIVDHLKQAGVRLRDGTRDETQARSVERLVCFEDPDGNPFELFSAARCSLRPFQSTLMPRGFLTGYTGMGHVLLTVRDLDRTRAFYCDVLGFVNHGYLDWQDVGLKGLFLLQPAPSLDRGGPNTRRQAHASLHAGDQFHGRRWLRLGAGARQPGSHRDVARPAYRRAHLLLLWSHALRVPVRGRLRYPPARRSQ